jgi:hypothetical protein
MTFVFFGAVMGLGQYVLLRRQSALSWLWIPLNGGSLLAGALVAAAAMFPIAGASSLAVARLAGLPLCGLVLGFLTSHSLESILEAGTPVTSP